MILIAFCLLLASKDTTSHWKRKDVLLIDVNENNFLIWSIDNTDIDTKTHAAKLLISTVSKVINWGNLFLLLAPHMSNNLMKQSTFTHFILVFHQTKIIVSFSWNFHALVYEKSKVYDVALKRHIFRENRMKQSISIERGQRFTNEFVSPLRQKKYRTVHKHIMDFNKFI